MLLQVKDVHFRYPGNIEVLRGASFYVNRGEVVAIIGPNGSGKSTLLMIAAGLLIPEKGEVLLNQKPLKDQLPEARRKIGLVFQDPDDQLFNPTVYDELAFSLRQILPSESKVSERIAEFSDAFGLRTLLEKPPYKLSIGEKRMVTLASVLIYEPDALLLDEPTANLSSKAMEKVEQVIAAEKEKDKGIVVTSHDVDFVAEVSDRVYVINSGTALGGLDARTVLSDERLLALADMRLPSVLQAVKLLKVTIENVPLTIKDLLELSRSKTDSRQK